MVVSCFAGHEGNDGVGSAKGGITNTLWGLSICKTAIVFALG